MPDRDPPITPQDPAARRRSVVRTAWVMAGVAFAIYLLFILSGVLGK